MLNKSRTIQRQDEKSSAVVVDNNEKLKTTMTTATMKPFRMQIVWFNVFRLALIHALALVGLIFSVVKIQWKTLVLSYGFLMILSLVGITAGAHRLWSHRSYRANVVLRIILMLANTVACQNDIYVWTRDHRAHHRFSETDADPHNSNRGFFFAHMGWLMCRKHPEVIRKGATIDLADLRSDPVVMFQHRFFLPMAALFGFILPTFVPYLLWGEDIVHGFLVCVCLRYVYTLHATWLVNSVSHMFGNRPFDHSIEPRENALVTFASFGEGYHNFHHTFPWHYSTSELGWQHTFNITTMFIDFFAWLGWVTDRKTVSASMVAARKARTGEKPVDNEGDGDGDDDEDHHHHHHHDDNGAFMTMLVAAPEANCLSQQVLGGLVGTCSFWVPCLMRVLYNNCF